MIATLTASLDLHLSTNPEHTGTLPSSRFRWIFLYLALLLGLCLPVAGSATWLSDETHKGRILTPPPVQTAARWQDDYDAENYSLTIDIDFDRLMISGTMTLSGKTLMSNFDELVLNLTDSLTVTSIQRAGNALSFTHTDSLLTISLDTIFQPDDTWSVTVVGGHYKDDRAYYKPETNSYVLRNPKLQKVV